MSHLQDVTISQLFVLLQAFPGRLEGLSTDKPFVSSMIFRDVPELAHSGVVLASLIELGFHKLHKICEVGLFGASEFVLVVSLEEI